MIRAQKMIRLSASKSKTLQYQSKLHIFTPITRGYQLINKTTQARTILPIHMSILKKALLKQQN